MFVIMSDPSRKEYERDLRERQRQHLENVFQPRQWQPCAHDRCPQCVGTGIKADGTACIHDLYCSCHKCSPHC